LRREMPVAPKSGSVAVNPRLRSEMRGTRVVLEAGELGCGPAAAEGFDEQDAGVKSALRDFDVVTLIGESGGLRSDHLEVRIDTSLVARLEEIEGLLGGFSGGALLFGLGLQDAQCG
jgi:hypothetical protein